MEGTAARCDPAKGPGGGAQSGAASGLVSWRGGGGDEAGKAGEAFIIFSKTMTISFFFFLVFLGLHPQQMEVPRLGVKLKLQLLAYTTATAIPDLSCVCNLCHSSQQHQVLNSLSEARDQTCVLMDTSWVRYC